jgi:hypothetical protein
MRNIEFKPNTSDTSVISVISDINVIGVIKVYRNRCLSQGGYKVELLAGEQRATGSYRWRGSGDRSDSFPPDAGRVSTRHALQ